MSHKLPSYESFMATRRAHRDWQTCATRRFPLKELSGKRQSRSKKTHNSATWPFFGNFPVRNQDWRGPRRVRLGGGRPQVGHKPRPVARAGSPFRSPRPSCPENPQVAEIARLAGAPDWPSGVPQGAVCDQPARGGSAKPESAEAVRTRRSSRPAPCLPAKLAPQGADRYSFTTRTGTAASRSTWLLTLPRMPRSAPSPREPMTMRSQS